MPFYRIWYQNKTEPLEFSSAGISREDVIVAKILEHEQIAAADGATPQQLIEQNNLAPVRYTEDESEAFTIV